MRRLHPIYSIFLRLLPFLCAAAGWFIYHWIGAIAGFLIGIPLFILFWFLGIVIAIKRRHAKNRLRMAPLTTAELLEYADNPLHPDFGPALLELDRRGVKARPSREKVISMLLSPNSNHRGMAMGMLSIVCPGVQLPKGCSNMDPPEVWKAHLQSLGLIP